MLAGYSEVSESDAADRLLRHLNADDFNALNNDQRIILASHQIRSGGYLGRPLAEREGPGRRSDHLRSS